MGRFFDFDLTVLTRLPSVWALLIHLVVASIVSIHVILRKRDPRSAIAWLAVIWLSPFIGVFFYYVLGVNRITRRASKLRPRVSVGIDHREKSSPISGQNLGQFVLSERLIPYVDQLVSRPLVGNNKIEVLVGGAAAFPAMISAILAARHSVTMSSYIFDRGSIARQIIGALNEASSKGVEVRVLIDAVGAHYSIPTVNSLFRRAQIKMRYFLPVIMPWQFGATNLRNHRKLLIVDGQTAFTGGLNIRDRHDLRISLPGNYVNDLHFKITGPVATQLQDVFADDWNFATGEKLIGTPWFQNQERHVGGSYCRAVADGPDEDFEKIKWMLLGAVSKAVERVWIVSPYFVPDTDLVSCLKIAAISGVDVRIMVPSKNNIPLVHWASLALLPGLVDVGVKVFLSDPPFDHSKLMIVDREWSFIGSSNWDARSLRLNFELNIEVYDKEVNEELADLFFQKESHSERLNRDWFDRRSLPKRIRDNSARLLSPYL